MSETYNDVAELKRVIHQLQRAILTNPQDSEAHAILGGLLWRQRRDAERAIALLQEAARLNPNGADTHNELAMLYKAKGRKEDARRALLRCLKVRPQYGRGYRNLAILCKEDGPENLKLAIRSLLTAVALDPNDAASWLNWGWWLLSPDGEAVYNAFQEIEAENRPVNPHDVSRSLSISEQDFASSTAEAIPYLQRLLNDMASASVAREYLARHAFESCLAVDSRNHAAWIALGRLYSKTGSEPFGPRPGPVRIGPSRPLSEFSHANVTMARVCFLQAVTCNPATPDTFEALGTLLAERCGDKEGAVFCLRLAMGCEKQKPSAVKALQAKALLILKGNSPNNASDKPEPGDLESVEPIVYPQLRHISAVKRLPHALAPLLFGLSLESASFPMLQLQPKEIERMKALFFSDGSKSSKPGKYWCRRSPNVRCSQGHRMFLVRSKPYFGFNTWSCDVCSLGINAQEAELQGVYHCIQPCDTDICPRCVNLWVRTLRIVEQSKVRCVQSTPGAAEPKSSKSGRKPLAIVAAKEIFCLDGLASVAERALGALLEDGGVASGKEARLLFLGGGGFVTFAVRPPRDTSGSDEALCVLMPMKAWSRLKVPSLAPFLVSPTVTGLNQRLIGQIEPPELRSGTQALLETLRGETVSSCPLSPVQEGDTNFGIGVISGITFSPVDERDLNREGAMTTTLSSLIRFSRGTLPYHQGLHEADARAIMYHALVALQAIHGSRYTLGSITPDTCVVELNPLPSAPDSRSNPMKGFLSGVVKSFRFIPLTGLHPTKLGTEAGDGDDSGETPILVGTHHAHLFTAPERLPFARSMHLLGESESHASATDVYALGCVWTTLLTGQWPFTGSLQPGAVAVHQHIPTELRPSCISGHGFPTEEEVISGFLRVYKLGQHGFNIDRMSTFLSTGLLQLLGAMQSNDPTQRIRLGDILGHPYFVGGPTDIRYLHIPHSLLADEAARSPLRGAVVDSFPQNSSWWNTAMKYYAGWPIKAFEELDERGSWCYHLRTSIRPSDLARDQLLLPSAPISKFLIETFGFRVPALMDLTLPWLGLAQGTGAGGGSITWIVLPPASSFVADDCYCGEMSVTEPLVDARTPSLGVHKAPSVSIRSCGTLALNRVDCYRYALGRVLELDLLSSEWAKRARNEESRQLSPPAVDERLSSSRQDTEIGLSTTDATMSNYFFEDACDWETQSASLSNDAAGLLLQRRLQNPNFVTQLPLSPDLTAVGLDPAASTASKVLLLLVHTRKDVLDVLSTMNSGNQSSTTTATREPAPYSGRPVYILLPSAVDWTAPNVIKVLAEPSLLIGQPSRATSDSKGEIVLTLRQFLCRAGPLPRPLIISLARSLLLASSVPHATASDKEDGKGPTRTMTGVAFSLDSIWITVSPTGNCVERIFVVPVPFTVLPSLVEVPRTNERLKSSLQPPQSVFHFALVIYSLMTGGDQCFSDCQSLDDIARVMQSAPPSVSDQGEANLLELLQACVLANPPKVRHLLSAPLFDSDSSPASPNEPENFVTLVHKKIDQGENIGGAWSRLWAGPPLEPVLVQTSIAIDTGVENINQLSGATSSAPLPELTKKEEPSPALQLTVAPPPISTLMWLMKSDSEEKVACFVEGYGDILFLLTCLQLPEFGGMAEHRVKDTASSDVRFECSVMVPAPKKSSDAASPTSVAEDALAELAAVQKKQIQLRFSLESAETSPDSLLLTLEKYGGVSSTGKRFLFIRDNDLKLVSSLTQRGEFDYSSSARRWSYYHRLRFGRAIENYLMPAHSPLGFLFRDPWRAFLMCLEVGATISALYFPTFSKECGLFPGRPGDGWIHWPEGQSDSSAATQRAVDFAKRVARDILGKLTLCEIEALDAMWYLFREGHRVPFPEAALPSVRAQTTRIEESLRQHTAKCAAAAEPERLDVKGIALLIMGPGEKPVVGSGGTTLSVTRPQEPFLWQHLPQFANFVSTLLAQDIAQYAASSAQSTDTCYLEWSEQRGTSTCSVKQLPAPLITMAQRFLLLLQESIWYFHLGEVVGSDVVDRRAWSKLFSIPPVSTSGRPCSGLVMAVGRNMAPGDLILPSKTSSVPDSRFSSDAAPLLPKANKFNDCRCLSCGRLALDHFHAFRTIAFSSDSSVEFPIETFAMVASYGWDSHPMMELLHGGEKCLGEVFDPSETEEWRSQVMEAIKATSLQKSLDAEGTDSFAEAAPPVPVEQISVSNRELMKSEEAQAPLLRVSERIHLDHFRAALRSQPSTADSSSEPMVCSSFALTCQRCGRLAEETYALLSRLAPTESNSSHHLSGKPSNLSAWIETEVYGRFPAMRRLREARRDELQHISLRVRAACGLTKPDAPMVQLAKDTKAAKKPKLKEGSSAATKPPA